MYASRLAMPALKCLSALHLNDAPLVFDSAAHPVERACTRAAFLREASRVLKAGGSFAAADIVVASDHALNEDRSSSSSRSGELSHTWQRRLVCKLIGIPLDNM